MYKITAILTLVCMLLIADPSLAEDATVSDNSAGQRVTDAGMALELALSFTGFGRARYVKTDRATDAATTTTVTDDKTPFLSGQINGRAAWRVTFDSVYLDLPGYVPGVVANQSPKTFEVLLESETGRLLGVSSVVDESDTMVAEEPPADYAEQNLRASGEVYHGLVEGPTDTDFLEALAAAVPSTPIQARGITASLVMHSDGTKEPKPVWCITGRGTPLSRGISGHGRLSSAKGPNHVRSVVDATDGQLLFATNRPHLSAPAGP